MLDTQKWKIVEGPHGNQILSVVRNTQRLDSLKIIQTGTDLLCCKVKRGGQPIWSFGDNVAPAQAPAGNTILVFNAPGVRNIEQEKTNRLSVLRSLPPDVYQDLECAVCLEMMGRKGAQVFQCTQSHLICPRYHTYITYVITFRGEGDSSKANFCLLLVQLNEYQTDPYFIYLSQNMTTDCLLI